MLGGGNNKTTTMENSYFQQYLQKRECLADFLQKSVDALSFEEAEAFYEDILQVSTDDAFIAGLEILDRKEEGCWVNRFTDSFGCMLFADGNYSMLPYLIEKMDSKEGREKERFRDYIRTLILGCSQTREPLQEGDELELEVDRLIKTFRKK